MNVRKWPVLLLAALLLIGLTACQEQPEHTGADEKRIVTFYSDDGTILKIDHVEEGGTAVPPAEPQMSYGTVFQSWDGDFSGVTEDLSIHPVCENVKAQTNAFVMAGTYGKTGETVTVPVSLCGQVCVAGFDATICYDPAALELVAVAEDGAVLYNDEVPGKLRLNFVSAENTEVDVDICRLQFRIKAENGAVPVTMELHSIYACGSGLESTEDEMYVPQAYLVDGTVHVIP